MHFPRLRVDPFNDLGDPQQSVPGTSISIDPGTKPIAGRSGRQQRQASTL